MMKSGSMLLAPTVLLTFIISSNQSTHAQMIDTATPVLKDMPLKQSVTQHGITWHFKEPVRVGQFVNGDYYVVGPVTITAIDPTPTEGRNGSLLNPDPRSNKVPFDDRVAGKRYRADTAATLPIEMKPGDALLSSRSADKVRAHRCLFRIERNISPIWSYSVLTCLAKPVPADTFRPGYCDRQQRLYYARDLQWDRLQDLAHVEPMPDIDRWAQLFRQPWFDLVGFSFAAAAEYQPQYAREIARAEGLATLLLNMDFPKDRKQPLLINFVQYGIDLWSICRDLPYRRWTANGGHGSGRKWAIVFSGMMLGNDAMASPSQTNPEIRFGQDMQTMHDKAWTGADVVYAGHRGVWKGKPAGKNPAQQPYEHLHPSQWAYNTFHYPGRERPTTQYEGEVYRRAINSPAWVGIALAGRIMQAEPYYAHDAFFDYADRWMTEDDKPLAEQIMQAIDVEQTSHDFRQAKFRGGQVFDPYVESMWRTYRDDLPPPRHDR